MAQNIVEEDHPALQTLNLRRFLDPALTRASDDVSHLDTFIDPWIAIVALRTVETFGITLKT